MKMTTPRPSSKQRRREQHTKSDSLSSPHTRSTTDHILGGETISATSDQPQPTDTTSTASDNDGVTLGMFVSSHADRDEVTTNDKGDNATSNTNTRRGIPNETCTCRKPGYVNTAWAVLSRVTDSTLRSGTQATCSQPSQYLGHFQKSASERSVRDSCTFVSKSVSSVVDYFLLSCDVLSSVCITSLEVENMIESDHLPVVLAINVSQNAAVAIDESNTIQENRQTGLTEKIIWQEDKEPI